MRYKKTVLSLLLFFGLLSSAAAQRAELGIDAGGAGYMGDLNLNNPIKISGISAGVFAKINFDPYWGLGLYYTFGGVKANDLSSSNADLRNRGLNFKTNLHEVSILTEFNFFDIYSPVAKKRFSPFVFAGIGGFIFNPKANYNGGGDIVLRNYTTEGPANIYKNYALTIPYGAGVKYRWTENLTFFSKVGYRKALTDYIDDVSGVYAPDNSWDNRPESVFIQSIANRTSSPRALPGSQRGDFRKRDTYMFVSIGISYTFVSQKCFTF